MLLAPQNHQEVLDRINSVRLIDLAERYDNFDVQAVGTTATLIDGLELEIPPQTRSWRLGAHIYGQLLTGTAASGTLQAILLYAYDSTSGTDVGPYAVATMDAVAGAVTNRQWNDNLILSRPFAPNAASRYMRLFARTIIATPTGWSQATLLAGDIPNSGNAGPMLFWAESVND